MMTHYLGVDAGGTHTRFVIFDREGNIVYKHTAASIHFMKVGYDGIKTAFELAKEEISKMFPLSSLGVVIGMAGYGADPTIRKGIENSVWSVFPGATLMSDAKFAMISALNHQDGVYVISGTGSIALRQIGDKEERRGGFGFLLGDEGSAFWIGSRLLGVFTKEADGRLPKTDLFEAMMIHFGVQSPFELIDIAKNAKDDRRNWVANVSVAMSCVDSVHAKKVYEEAGLELASLANSFEIEGPTRIAFGGGVLLHNQIVRATFISNLRNEFFLESTKFSVEYASYLLLNRQV